MAVDTYALTDVATVSIGLPNATVGGFTIYHDQSVGATAATVQVTTSTLVLIISGGANAGTTTYTLTDAASDTLGELVSAINALAKGWVAAMVSGTSTAHPSTDLAPLAQVSVYGAGATATLGTRDLVLVELLINAMSGYFEFRTGRRVLTRTHKHWFDGDGSQVLLLKQWPVTAVTRIHIGRRSALRVTNTSTTHSGAWVSVSDPASTLTMTWNDSAGARQTSTCTFATDATVTAVAARINLQSASGWSATVLDSLGAHPSTDIAPSGGLHALGENVELEIPQTAMPEYRVNFGRAMVYYGSASAWTEEDFADGFGRFTEGRRNIFAEYVAGYATTDLGFYPIKELVTEMVTAVYNRFRNDPNMQSERLGDYSYVRAALGEQAKSFDDRMMGWANHAPFMGVC